MIVYEGQDEEAARLTSSTGAAEAKAKRVAGTMAEKRMLKVVKKMCIEVEVERLY
jgi:hypothetical protein